MVPPSSSIYKYLGYDIDQRRSNKDFEIKDIVNNRLTGGNISSTDQGQRK